jgi:hypothetical protein
MDDASPAVRRKVADRLRQMGQGVWQHVEENRISLSADQRHRLREILVMARPSTLVAQWPDWLLLRTENERLEAAFSWLSRRSLGEGADEELKQMLDRLARDYLRSGGVADPEELSHYLFSENQIGMARTEQDAHPAQSDLLQVLRGGQGLPISLAAIFILVGWRLDIVIYGCNFPGHFLARAPLCSESASEDDLVFDLYNYGRVLRPDEVAALRKASPQELSTPATAREMMARVLRNIANAHFLRREPHATRAIFELLDDLENADS